MGPHAVSVDVFDDVDSEDSALTDLLGDVSTEKPGEEPPLFLDVALWKGQPVPERQWVVPGWVPAGVVTLLYGDGGLGKSQLGLQQAHAVATGGEWLGLPVTAGDALVLAAEDDETELRIRLAGMCRESGWPTPGRMRIAALVDGNPVLAEQDAKRGGVRETELYRKLKAAVRATKPELLVLDTLGNLFAGNESDRAQVTQFMGLMRALATRHGMAVLLLAHPSKAGMLDGSGASGSTGWKGTARSMLYLETATFGRTNVEVDPDLRRLRHLKANYGPKSAPLTLRWAPSGFRQDAFGDHAVLGDAAAAFLELLEVYKGRPLNMQSGPTYAPKVFVEHPRGKLFGKDLLTEAMRQLARLGRIQEDEITGQHRHKVKTIVAVDEESGGSGDPFAGPAESP